MNSRYHEAYAGWRESPETFWGEAARAIDWDTPYERVFDESMAPAGRWFPGGALNSCYNLLDRHVANGRAESLALVHVSAMTGDVRRFTYADLLIHVARLAGALRKLGVRPGDRVLIYMPMVPEAVIGMLACARLGAVHSVVFGGFAARELAARIDDATPAVILAASCGLEPGRTVNYKQMLDQALCMARHAPGACLVLQRPELAVELQSPRDHDWIACVGHAEPVECVPVSSTAPSYILYTSGTTGRPKGIVRDTAGHLVALAWSMRNIFGAEPGETFWAASDIGWVVGHSYIVYGPLLNGCATVLYEGNPVGTPDAGVFWRIVQEHDVRTLFAAPTALRAIRREDPEGALLRQSRVASLRALFLAGERADPDTVRWAEDQLQVPVIDNWWQTETGWPIVSNFIGLGLLPVRHGSPTMPVPGYDVRVVDASGNEVERGTMGSIVVKRPLPPGCLPTLWKNDEGFVSGYLNQFPGYYASGDAGFRDADGYVYVMSRTDDIINVAGHRLSTGEIEQVLAHHPAVAECAVIGAKDDIKGAVPVGVVALKSGIDRAHESVSRDLIRWVRDEIGPVASFKACWIVTKLPKTRSGKVLRGVMRRIADGVPYEVPPTIDDPLAVEEFNALFASAHGHDSN
ncbi:MAG TPA: AMP-binding protein [Verrucomicrobiae bacterium]|nr:AMP-binding protein [Verrucomicrobiae bacterium]